MISYGMIRDCFPRLAPARLQIFTEAFNLHFPAYGLTSPIRIAAFMAQIGHESGDLRHTVEIWGPTPQQRRYEPPSELANRLGNTQPGDGERFKGRGLIQVTGRFNYAQLSQALGEDFIGKPALLESPNMAVKSACWWWSSRNLNDLADANDEHNFRKITRIINGGLNGWDDRLERWQRYKNIFVISGNNASTVA